ncbi:MAG: tail fiber domain-containing protein [Bacteroidia bacterium]
MKIINSCYVYVVLIAATILLSTNLQAQGLSDQMSYQAVIRKADNTLLINKPVGVRISIIKDTASGQAVYVETHTKSTNSNGLVQLEIGGGTAVSGKFDEIDWENGPFHLKVETDPAGRANYGLVSLSPMRSVPYSKWAWGSACCNNQWHLGGNSNTNAATHFLGTTNNQTLNFRVNGVKSGQIDHILFNSFYGSESGKNNHTGKWNSGFGNQTLRDLTTGHDNTAIGDEVLTFNRTGSQNTAVGEGAMFKNQSGDNNTASGYTALLNNQSGHSNVANGVAALYSNPFLSYLVAVGDSALYNTGLGFNAATPKGSGIDNTALGSKSLLLNIGGASNTGAGFHSLLNNTSGNGNTGIGRKALFANKTGNDNTGLGHSANVASDTLNNATALGANAYVGASNSMVLGSISGVNSATASTNVGIGTTMPQERLHIVGKIKIVDGTEGLNKVLTSDANGVASWANAAAMANDSDNWNLNGNVIVDSNFLGTINNKALNFKVNNTNSGTINPTSHATFLGIESGIANTTGGGNSAFGSNSLKANTTGHMNTALGQYALFSNTTSNGNLAAGQGAMYQNTTGAFNAGIGQNALFNNTTGSLNSALGSGADVSTGALNYSTAIGARAYVTQSNSLVLGSINGINGALASTNVGIGNTAPTARLHVTGQVRIADGTEGAGKVLTSDANGLAMWANASGTANDSDDWTLNGNTVVDSNFIGTINNKALNFKVNNTNSGTINPTSHATFLGYESGIANTTGGGNSAFGSNALKANTTGHMNTALGQYALFSSTTSNGNLAAGQGSMYQNTTGAYNAGIGQNALFNNTTGSFNSAFGSGADVSTGALSNATAVGARAYVTQSNSLILGAINGINGSLASTNVGIGNNAPTARLHITGQIRIADGTEGAGKVLTSDANGLAIWANAGSAMGPDSSNWKLNGNHVVDSNFIGTLNNKSLKFRVNNIFSGIIDPTLENTFLGYTSGNATMTGNQNAAFGTFALSLNTTGTGNTASGRSALRNNTTGVGNTGTGASSLTQNTIGNANTAFGNQSLRTNSTGNNNTAVGYSALVNSNGSENTATGINALQANTTGSSNTAQGASAMILNTTGSMNTALGEGALLSNTVGTSNTAVGRNANVASNNLTNATALGAGATVCASNTMLFGNTAVTGWGFGTCAGSNAITVGTNSGNGNGASLTLGGTWTSTSDSTKKYNIHKLQYGLAEVMKLKPVAYMFKGTTTPDIGFLAQEVKQIIPEVVYGNEGNMTMSYAQLTAVLTNAMQEQQALIEKLLLENAAAKAEIATLRSDISQIKQFLNLSTVNASK